ncbi:hypothetical protein BaRGS_00033902 [Batillaria attramentaria]|uniref:Uncharacterized protein n=1 Tax=Batillaria attramentaria TaxID=370345 RepID=A0ABD0JIQ4_9CAEN
MSLDRPRLTFVILVYNGQTRQSWGDASTAYTPTPRPPGLLPPAPSHSPRGYLHLTTRVKISVLLNTMSPSLHNRKANDGHCDIFTMLLVWKNSAPQFLGKTATRDFARLCVGLITRQLAMQSGASSHDGQLL